MRKPSDVEAMTHLLQAHNAEISAVKANKILLQLELLVERERPSSKTEGVMKKYKALSDEGLKFGINYENPQSPEQTSPYYYKESFGDLLAKILEHEAASD